MAALSSVSDLELRERLSAAVSTERAASADVIFHLAELDRRRLYLEDACSSTTQAVEQVRVRGVEPRAEPLLRAAIAVLTP